MWVSHTKQINTVSLFIIVGKPSICTQQVLFEVPTEIGYSMNTFRRDIRAEDIPRKGKIHVVVEHLLPVLCRLKGWLGVSTNAAIVVFRLSITVVEMSIQFDDICVLGRSVRKNTTPRSPVGRVLTCLLNLFDVPSIQTTRFLPSLVILHLHESSLTFPALAERPSMGLAGFPTPLLCVRRME